MRKIIISVCLLCLPALLFGQNESQEEVLAIAELRWGQELKLDHSSYEFLKVISDSRCPKQVTCIWPGEAKILLGFTANGIYIEKEVIVPNSGVEIPLSNEVLMQIFYLSPYPETAKGIAPEDYCLRFSLVAVED